MHRQALGFRHLLLLSSPFSTAFYTPRPPDIQIGVRDVPPFLSQHPEDLYDALEIEFNKGPDSLFTSVMTFHATYCTCSKVISRRSFVCC